MLQSQNMLTIFSQRGSGLFPHSEAFSYFLLLQVAQGDRDRGCGQLMVAPLCPSFLMLFPVPAWSIHRLLSFRMSLLQPGLSMGHRDVCCMGHRALPVQLQGWSIPWAGFFGASWNRLHLAWGIPCLSWQRVLQHGQGCPEQRWVQGFLADSVLLIQVTFALEVVSALLCLLLSLGHAGLSSLPS